MYKFNSIESFSLEIFKKSDLSGSYLGVRDLSWNYALQFNSTISLSLFSKEVDFIGTGVILNERWIITHIGVIFNEKSDASYAYKILVSPKIPPDNHSIWSHPALETRVQSAYSVEKTFCSILGSNDMALLKLHKPIPLNRTFENFQAIAITKRVDWKNKKFIAAFFGVRMFSNRHTEYIYSFPDEYIKEKEFITYVIIKELIRGASWKRMYYQQSDENKYFCGGENGSPIVYRNELTSVDELVGLVYDTGPNCSYVISPSHYMENF